MSVPTTVADVIDEHVRFPTEGIDRMYLNVYVPILQSGGGGSFFLRASGRSVRHGAGDVADAPRLRTERRTLRRGARRADRSLREGVRQKDVFHERLTHFDGEEGVVMIGKAQEKAPVYRTTKRRCEQTGRTFPWPMKSTAMVNHYDFYCVDKEFGLFFIKFCSYFPYSAKLCLNGHE